MSIVEKAIRGENQIDSYRKRNRQRKQVHRENYETVAQHHRNHISSLIAGDSPE